MTTINYVAIRKDGRTITGQKDSLYDAATELRKMLNDSFYSSQSNPIKKVFLSDGESLMEYLPSEIEDTANWQEGR
jgi:hypothetical protein